MSAHGVLTVARQEFRLRLRAGRWRWLLAAWFGVLLVYTVLVRLALGATSDYLAGSYGAPMFAAVILLVLGLGLLVVPALTAQSVNGDRERGTLASLQVTTLTPAEIAVGKLVAAWGTSLAFLALSVPLLLWAYAEGGVGVGQLLGCLLIVAVQLGVVCALAQALSALLARSTTSAVLAYLTVFGLTVGTGIAFALASAATTEERQVTARYPVWDDPQDPLGEGPPTRYETETYTEPVQRTDRTWWLLAPNPFVVLADAAPQAPRPPETANFGYVAGEEVYVGGAESDPLSELGREVRRLRVVPDTSDRTTDYSVPEVMTEEDEGPAVWPWGLGIQLLLGAGALALTVRRLRTPTRSLPRGVRVA